MDFIPGLALAVMKISAVAAALLIDAAMISRLFCGAKAVDALASRGGAVLVLFLMAFLVKMVV